jgi:hypothetical protein
MHRKQCLVFFVWAMNVMCVSHIHIAIAIAIAIAIGCRIWSIQLRLVFLLS